jgi:ABC-2 type transport system permease protein
MTGFAVWWGGVSGIAARQSRAFFTNPALIIPGLLFPMLFFAAFAGGLSDLTRIPGFDYAPGYTSFQYVFVLFQSSMFGGIFIGFAVARDFENGFARRLMLGAPHRSAILFGYALSAMIRAAFTIIFVTVIALVAGIDIMGSPAEVVLLYLLALLSNILGSLWALGIAFRFQSLSATPFMQIPLFILLFLAPVYVPLQLLGGWIRHVADVNPATFLLEGGRALLAGSAGPVLAAWLVIIVGGIVLGIWSLSGLRAAETR